MQYMLFTNIHMDSSTKRGLLLSPLLLDEKEDNLLDQFDNNSVVKLEFGADLVFIPGSSRLSFSQASEEESTSTLKWKLASTRSKKIPLLLWFEEAKNMIEVVLGF